MTTYTLLNRSGEPEYRGLSLIDAAQQRLYYGGAIYKVEPTGDWWHLWMRGANERAWRGPCWDGPAAHGKPIMVHIDDAADRDAAFAAMAPAIVTAQWRDGPEVLTDADYDAMMAEAEG